MVEAAGVEPASETPWSHEIRRLPVTHRRVSWGLSPSVNPKVNTTNASWDQPTFAGGSKNVLGRGRISFPIEHWGSRSPQTLLFRQQPGQQSGCCCWQLNQFWTVKAVPYLRRPLVFARPVEAGAPPFPSCAVKLLERGSHHPHRPKPGHLLI